MRNGNSFEDFVQTPTLLNNSHDVSGTPEIAIELLQIMRIQNLIREKKRKKIVFQEPIISRNGEGVIFPRTINLVQGRFGRHKSRIVETLCAALIKHKYHIPDNEHLGFHINPLQEYALLYVDTERNIIDQFPHALQQIQLQAGYPLDDEPDTLDYVSLLPIERKKRYSVFEAYLEQVRERFRLKHVVVILDVVTDLITNFNDPSESMKIVDLLNKTTNEYDVTFVCVIHENPNGEGKARGHAGTELTNKATTVIGLDFVRDSADKETDTLCVRYVKCRNTKRYEPFYAHFHEERNKLFECERPSNAEQTKEEEKRALCADIFKGIRMTRKGFARDYAVVKGLAETSKAGFEIFKKNLENGWIVEDTEKTPEGDQLYWFADDKLEKKSDSQAEIFPDK